MNKVFILFFLTFSSFSLFSQTGKIRGTVTDGSTGEAMIGVTALIKGTQKGAVTDFDGNFVINIEPGTYDLQISFVSYQTIVISDVVVEAGEVNVLDNIILQESVEELQEVIVTATVIKDSEAALLTVKKKSANLLDGISAAKFRKIGDSDAASAVKRVTGVSIEGDKYVYVRGLGDRYTKTTLNNVDIPGLDPDRNSIQIDIFPTNLIQNMIVSKTALAEMPADFTGGVVNIETKDFPEEKILNASFGVTYNPSMHFNDDFITYEGSDTDWLGYDTDLRELPDAARGDIPRPISNPDQEVFNFTKQFSQVLQNQPETSFMNYNLGFSVGNQLEVGNSNNIGYILSLTYKANQNLYDDQQYGEFQNPLPDDPNGNLIEASLKDGVQTTDSRFVGGLAGIAFKTDVSKFRLTALRLQNGEKRSGGFRIVEDVEDGRDATGKSNFIAPNSQNLEYSERSLTNFLLNGEHYLNGDSWVIDWRISPTFSKIEDPDIRVAALTDEFGLSFNAGAAGLPQRIWRFLDEVNLVGRLDVTKNLEMFERDAKIKFGTSYTYKERDYEILDYQLAFFGSQPDFNTPDLTGVLADENLYPNDGNAYYQSGVVTPNPNEYNSSAINTAFYVSTEFLLFPKLKSIFGLRAENFVQRHTGRDQIAAGNISSLVRINGLSLEEATAQVQAEENGGRVLDDEKVLDALDFFPSANLTYSLTEEQNLRFSYSRTIARPSFKELSFAQIQDPISNRAFNGGLFPFDTNDDQWDGDLSETHINNFDLRWEIFLSKGQTYSVSAFYKSFEDPIELVRIPAAQTSNELQVRNVGDSYVYGAEFEFRTSVGLISPSLDKFFFSGNVTLTESVLQMTNVEFVGREAFARPGEDIDDTRQMQGQAPYVVNAGLSYEDLDIGLDAGLFYNVQGPTLTVVGTRLFPDVFTEPFHSLNFNMNKSFGADERLSLNFSVTNILDDRREEFFDNDISRGIFTGFSPGTSYGIGASYKF